LADSAGAELVWSPVLLGAIYRETAAPQGAAGSASDVFNPTKKVITSRAIRRTIQRNNITIKWPTTHPQSPVLALRMLYAVPVERRPALSHGLFRAYWEFDQDITDKSLLLKIAKDHGLDLMESVFTDKTAQDLLRKNTANIIERGSPGVPGYWVPDEVWTSIDGRTHRGRLYWGQDRMHFVEAALLSLRHGSQWSKAPRMLDLLPRCKRGPASGRKRLEFWFDFSSPWAFLGWTQLERLRRQYGTKLEVVMKPILVGGLFKA
jgi:2-hydroxychromene-2-carboxylate isomerase